jgi:hypothetical protein
MRQLCRRKPTLLLRLQRVQAAEALMWSGRVEVGQVLVEHGAKMPLTEDDDVVETLATDTAKEAFAGRVHEGRARGCLEDTNARAVGDAIEVRARLGVALRRTDRRDPCAR